MCTAAVLCCLMIAHHHGQLALREHDRHVPRVLEVLVIHHNHVSSQTCRMVPLVINKQCTNVQVLKATPSCPPAMTMLADLCVISADQTRRQSLLRQRLHVLEQLKVADPLRRPYWKAQLLTTQASVAGSNIH